jgi:hypothetical protein
MRCNYLAKKNPEVLVKYLGVLGWKIRNVVAVVVTVVVIGGGGGGGGGNGGGGGGGVVRW